MTKSSSGSQERSIPPTSESEVVLGGEVVGPEASNIIAEIGLAVEMGALASDVHLTIHAHPTMSELLSDVARDAEASD